MIERFWSKVDRSGECWMWTAAVNDKGYGRFSLGGKQVPAHRVAWEAENGPVPAGFQIDHACHLTGCVNPAHLRLVTAKQNLENRGMFKNNTSGARGVYWSKRVGKWHARVCNNGRFVHCGYFDNVSDAARAAQDKRNALFTHNDADRSFDLIRPS